MINITLYTTAGCHLCEQAETMLAQLKLHLDLDITTLEIGDDDTLVEQYGIRIPVLKFIDDSELNWPFTADDVVCKLNNM